MTDRSAVAPSVTAAPTTARQWLSRVSFVGAAALLAVAAWPGGSSHAAAPPDYDYVAVASAVGIQAQLDSNPEPTPVPDLTDLEAPTSNARLDSFGTSSAQGDVGNLNGLGKLPGLICLAAGGCDSFPTPAGVTFPPANPLEADASDPAVPDAVAPSVAGQAATVSGGTSGVATYSAGVAHAHAVALATHTDVTASGFDLLSAIHVGAVTTTTDESAAESGVATAATSTVSDIDIGTGLIHIGSVTVTTTVTAVPGVTPKDTTSVSVGGVTVFGQSATIDGTGLHVAGTAPAAGQLQSLLSSTLAADGFAVSVGGVTRSDADDGHHVTGTGLILTLDTPVSGTPAVNVGLPAGVPCPIPAAVSSQLPVDPCSGVGLNLNAAYHGQIVLGQAGVVDEALTNPLLGGLPTFALPGSPEGTAATTATAPTRSAAAPGAPTTAAQRAPAGPGAGVAAGPSNAAAPGVDMAAGTPTSSTAAAPVVGAATPPTTAARHQTASALAAPLSNIGFGWILGALGLAGLGTLLGRWGVPARLPSRS